MPRYRIYNITNDSAVLTNDDTFAYLKSFDADFEVEDMEDSISDADYASREQAEIFDDRYQAWRNEY